MRGRKAQASFEYIILFTLFLAILGTVTFYTTNEISTYVRNNEIGDTARSISRAVNQISAVGPGTAKVIILKIPKSVYMGYTAYKEITFRTDYKGILSDTHFPTKTPVYGLLETGRGKKYIIMKVENNGYVSLSPLGAPNLTNELIGYYNFENTNSTYTLDATGKSNDGELLRGIDCTENRYIGKGCYFDGTDDSINISHNDSLNVSDGVSIVAWIRFNNTGSKEAIVSKWQDNNFRKSFILQKSATEYIEFVTSDDGMASSTLTSSSQIYTKKWYHIVVVYNTTDNIIYINGNYNNSIQNLDGIYNTAMAPIEIGRLTNIDNAYFDGAIDEVMIFNRALKPYEINKLYVLGRFPE